MPASLTATYDSGLFEDRSATLQLRVVKKTPSSGGSSLDPLVLDSSSEVYELFESANITPPSQSLGFSNSAQSILESLVNFIEEYSRTTSLDWTRELTTLAAPQQVRSSSSGEELIPNVEYDITLASPAKETYYMRGRIKSVDRGSARLALTEAEWSQFSNDADDERG